MTQHTHIQMISVQRAHMTRWRERTCNRWIIAAFCTRKRKAMFQKTFSIILASWSADAAWQKAVSVHAEFLGIERKNKSDAPMFRSWLALTRAKLAGEQRVQGLCQCRAMRTRFEVWAWWRSWTSACVVIVAARKGLQKKVLKEVWNSWWNLAYSTRRKLEFFVAYRERGNMRKSLEVAESPLVSCFSPPCPPPAFFSTFIAV